ncbi:MAG: DUF805 domain-containing protein [Pseudomonadota bacterium]
MRPTNISSLFFSFSGAIGRREFWIGMAGIAAAGAALVGGAFATVNSSDAELAAVLVGIPLIYPLLAVYSKRIRDRGLSQAWLITLAVPMIGLIWGIVDLGTRPGISDEHQDPIPATA